MKKAEDYLTHARECRELAANARDEGQRDMLLKMADTWDGLAESRKQEVARQERIRALEIRALEFPKGAPPSDNSAKD